MDIVKRAYLKTKEEFGVNRHGTANPELQCFHEAVIEEMKRLIKVRAYGGPDWPSREFGPLPDELRAKRTRQDKTSCTPETPCCDRRDEYNGFASGPLKFVCPKHCPCHD